MKKISLYLILLLVIGSLSGCMAYRGPDEEYIFPDRGSAEGDSFGDKIYWLNCKDGSGLNFYLRNEGDCDVVIYIGDDLKKTIAPGESGSLFTKIAPYGGKYECEVRPAINGDKFKVSWNIDVVE